ncbi:unnamed protein product [Absidia cylindrospora]
MDTTTYDQRFFGPIDLFDETVPTSSNASHFDNNIPSSSLQSSSAPSHTDMLMYSMYPPASSAQHPLDPSPIHPFYSMNSNQVTPPQSSVIPTFMDDYQLPSSTSSSDLNTFDHSFGHPDSVPFPNGIDEFYNSCPQSSPSSYLQYLQQSPMSSVHHQQQYKQQQSQRSNQHPSFQPSKAATTPLDILDPQSVRYTNFTVPPPTDQPNSSNGNVKQPPSISTTPHDLNHLAMNPVCPSSSVDYMNTKKSSSPCQWMMDSLDNTYLTSSDNPLNFYDNGQNNETSFYLDNHSYLSQQQQQMPSSMSSNSLHPSSSQNDINDLTSCLPRGYVNLSDVNSFVAESDSIKHTNSFPHLSFSTSKYGDIDGGGSNELQSLLGDISPATPSNNNSGFLAHSFPVPSYPNPQSSSYSYSDSNESMDDLSDSDTTTSTQSWMVPFPQDAFSSWRDPSTPSSSGDSFYPLGGMTSSISTPTGLGHHHPRLYPHHSHPLPRHHQSSTGSTYLAHDINTNAKRDKPTKKRGKQQQNQAGSKPRRSTSSLIHPGHRGSTANGHLQSSTSSAAAAAAAAVAAATITNRPSGGGGGRRRSTMSLDTKIKLNTSTSTKRKEVRRRESEPHSLSTINTSASTTSNSNHDIFSPARLSVSESISSFLSRQKLSDDEEDDMDQNNSDSDHDVGSSEDDDNSSGHNVYPHPYSHQKVPKNRQQYQQRRSNHNNDHNQDSAYVLSSGNMFRRGSSDSSDVGGPSAPSNHPAKKGRNVDKACNHCKRSHLRCDNMRPCRRCIATGKSGCKDVEHKPRGRPRLHNT